MTVYLLGQEPVFPPPHDAEDSGILAVGGDLSPERLIAAYSRGIFPWYSDGEPIVWWSPDPRLVLFPDEIHISRKLARLLKRNDFDITLDRDFEAVIEYCRQPRKYQRDTWITEEMARAYKNLHALEYAHSLEVWSCGRIVGGIYGVCLGACFFAESMFHLVSNASKIALVSLVNILDRLNFSMVDCQVSNSHLKSMGAREIPRGEFLKRLDDALGNDDLRCKWSKFENYK